MANRPFLSICCITYNHASYIRKALDGFVMQRTDFPFEVIVHDDASTDGTAEIIREYVDRYPDLIRPILQSENQFRKERGRVTKIVLGSAQGKFIALCEGDDYWTDPMKLQKQVDILEEHPMCAGCFHHSSVVDENDHEVKSLWRNEMQELIKLEDIVTSQAVFHTSSFVFRNFPWLRSMPPLFSRTVVGDLALFAMVAGEGPLIQVDGVMSAYRKHTGGITATAIHLGTRFHIERMRLWMYLDRHFPGRIREATSRVCGWHWNKIMEHTSGRERLSALRELFRDVPMWFVVRPRYALYLLRSALPR